MFKLSEFENYVDAKILERGKDYYENDQIEDLIETKKGLWHAMVYGSDNYSVEIELGKADVVLDYSCDCPYDYGAVCKHLVAVFYALCDRVIEIPIPEISTKKGKMKKLSFNELLKKIEFQELQNFIKTYSNRNEKFKSDFEIYFADKDDSIDFEQKYLGIIKKIFRSYTAKGFIDYNSSIKAAKEVQEHVNSMEQLFVKGNYSDAYAISKAIIVESCKVFDYCDDSQAYVLDCVEQAIEVLDELIESAAALELKEKMYDFLSKELQKEDYFEYADIGYSLMRSYEELAILTGKNDAFLQFVAKGIQAAEKKSYKKDAFIIIKISFLNRIGQEDAFQKEVEANLEVTEVRMLRVKELIENSDYASAKKLIKDGIKIAEKERSFGHVHQWEVKFLEIAYLENDIQLQRYYSKKFTFDDDVNMEYYKQWKNTFLADEWKTEIEKTVKEIKHAIQLKCANSPYFKASSQHEMCLSLLGPIFIAEEYWDRLFALLKPIDDLDTILAYHDDLANLYPQEYLELYFPAINNAAEEANTRNNYKELVRKIKIIIKYYPAAKERILNEVRNLKAKYPRRPAMIEELNRII